MTILYHEKQESALCGQHCLNNLLQGPYFNAGALADIAHELDGKEKALMMAEGMTADAIAFMREASGNVDEQGNFSIQVLSEALKRSFGLELSDVRHEEVPAHAPPPAPPPAAPPAPPPAPPPPRFTATEPPRPHTTRHTARRLNLTLTLTLALT